MDSPLKIYSGANALIYSTPVNTGCRRKVQLMSEDSITVKFSYKNRIIFPVGSRIGDFYTTEEQQGKYNANTDGYDYELKFSAYYWLWANKLLSYVMPGVTNAPKETSFNLTAPIETHAAIILRALNALGYTYNNSPFRVDTDADFSTEAKYIQYSNMSILGGIQAIAEAYECEWWVEGNAIHFGKCHASGEYDFTVGDNVSAITQSNTSKKGNRLFVFGSDRNLPPDYRTVDDTDVVDAIVTRRLMLPAGTPYLQIADNIPEDQIVEEEVVFDKVYPRTQLTISNITTYTSQAEDGKTQTFYRINYGNSFPFLKEYILPDEELHIVFESGDLNGMDFAVKFNPLGVGEKNDDGSINPTSQMFEIVVNEDYGRELPDSVLHPDVGDKFILHGWNATKMESLGLIAAAEQELLTEGQKVAEERKKDLATYTCPMMWDWCKAKSESNDMPKLGSIVNLHFETGDTVRKSRVIGYEHDLDIEYSNVTYTCGEKVSASRLKTLESKVDGLTHNGTKAKLQNSLDFLSKRYSDRTPYQLSSDIGFEAGNFTSGVSGGMLGIDKTDGSSFAEVDDMRVRRKAYFETLTTMEATTLAGKHYLTQGGSIKCVRVEEVKDTDGDVTAYRCWFLSEQSGEKTNTKIIEGDQCISEMFNAKTGTANKVSNHRYWRLVTGVSNDAHTDDAGNHYGYIDLSVTDCEPDSDIPQEDDVLVQFGNRTDVSRQGAIVLSAVDFDAPAIKMLAGIGSGDTAAEHYSLDGKDITAQGYDHTKGHAYMKVYGDTYIGAKDRSTYFNFDQDTKTLDIKAVVNILGGSVIDGELTLSSLIRVGYKQDGVLFNTMAGMNGAWIPELGGRTIAAWYGGPMVDLFDKDGNRLNLAAGTYAASLDRMDGSGYKANGNFRWKEDGTVNIGDETYGITLGSDGRIVLGNGIAINIGGNAQGLGQSIASVTNLANKLSNLFTPYIGTSSKNWSEITDIAQITSVKINAGVWTDGFLSARGLNPNGGGSGGAGKSYLSDLLDVDLADTLLDGQVLVYRDGKWTNETIEAASLSGYALESWVEANFQPKGDYLTNSAASTSYVSKAGDSMTGALNIGNSSQTQIWLNSSGTSETGIGLKINGATLGWVGYNTYRGTVLYTYDGSHYLGIHPNGTPRFDSNVIWHQGNDGSGSGLDADLLDGNHLADILASNVASASRLQTARTIWGHSFDGTGNVSGTLSDVGQIQMSGGIISGGTSQGAYIGHTGAGLGSTYTGGLLYAYGNNPLYFYTNSSRRMMINGNGNVGIGTDSSAFKLDVNGATRTTALVIGDCTISWDAANGMLKFDKGLYSEGPVSARGVNANGSTGSGSGNYLQINGDNATDATLPHLFQKLYEYDSALIDGDFMFVSDEQSQLEYGWRITMLHLWNYIKSKMGLSFVIDGDNVALSCQPGTLRINGNCSINSGGVISSVGANIGGTVSAYDFALTGPSPSVKVTYQGKTYTLQLAKMIEDGYLA